MNLRIYASRADLPAGDRHIVMLFPFWGLLPEPPGDKDEGRFDDYAREGGRFFTPVSSLAEADCAVLPFEWKLDSPLHEKIALRLAEEAKRHGKPLIIFFNNDSDAAIPIGNAVIFRTSFSRASRRPGEFAVPGWSVDFLHRYLGGKLAIRDKQRVPVVGYCGYVDYVSANLRSLALHAVRRATGRSIKIGAVLRGKAVRALLADPGVETNFIYRSGFGGSGDAGIRDSYVKNMVEADYPLVTRGEGNFSYRLYEVLSCGRIPLLIDTDCVLPFDDLIDWRSHCIWVGADQLDTVGERVREFHERIADRSFRELQTAARHLYEEWISPTGFFSNLWRCLPGECGSVVPEVIR